MEMDRSVQHSSDPIVVVSHNTLSEITALGLKGSPCGHGKRWTCCDSQQTRGRKTYSGQLTCPRAKNVSSLFPSPLHIYLPTHRDLVECLVCVLPKTMCERNAPSYYPYNPTAHVCRHFPTHSVPSFQLNAKAAWGFPPHFYRAEPVIHQRESMPGQATRAQVLGHFASTQSATGLGWVSGLRARCLRGGSSKRYDTSL